MEDKILYVVYANTYNDCWGAEIEIFGIADNEEDMNKIFNMVQKEKYCPQVEELTLNQYCRKYLGGYYE